MSHQAPSTLLELARQRLLRDEALAISALQYLPKGHIPPLFVKALVGKQTKVLSEMVAAWPWPCLPVGVLLMKTPHLETLKAVLDGVDKLLTSEVHPRSRKLQVLDLRNLQHTFWNTWAGMEDAGSSADVVSEEQIVKHLPRYALRRQLKVLADLSLKIHLTDFQTYLLQWAEQRRSLLRLCCPKVEISAFPLDSTGKVLRIVPPGSIEELHLHSGWSLSTLAQFSPYLGQMRHLRRLFIAPIRKTNFKLQNTCTDLDKCVTKFISQFSKFNCLQHLSLNGLYFVAYHMRQLFGCLKTPLETLSISHCLLSPCDLNSLYQSQSVRQLKHLSLRSLILFDFSPIPLAEFLDSVADTLQTLDLEACRMQDAQISALLPALSHCCRLTRVHLYDNDISMPILQNLLHCTANLSQLTLELYPAPLECFDDMGHVLPERFALMCGQLMDVLRTVRQPKKICFATDLCPECGSRSVYDLETKLCGCW